MKIIVALIVFGIIVVVHEFGHFIFAKANGIYVEEFSVGMGPTLFSWKKKETKYSLKLLPLGGSCMMMGEDENNDDERAFNNKSVWARFMVIFAGPLFNFILAFVLSLVLIGLVGADIPTVLTVEENSPATEAGLEEGDIITDYNGYHIGVGREIYLADYLDPIGDQTLSITYERDGEKKKTTLLPKEQKRYLMGISYAADDTSATVTVTEGGALDAAGMKSEDEIVEINGTKITSGKEFNAYVTAHPLTAEPVSITYLRDGEETAVEVTPVEDVYYTTGFTYNMNGPNEDVGIIGNIKYSALEIRYQIKSVILSLKYLFSGHMSADSVAGPVGIINMVGDSYSQSLKYGIISMLETMISFLIMLSANLGVMNLLPIPALDGGRLIFILVEMVRGKKIDPDKEGFVHFLGFVLLMILMVLILYNDIRRLFI